MYNILKHAHSGLRWVALILLVTVICYAASKWFKKSSEDDNTITKLSLFNFISAHLQLLIGLILFFVSPRINWNEGFMKEMAARFVHIEHPTMMIIAIVLISIGHIKAKKLATPQKYKTLMIFNAIALIIILAMIPWPFRALGGSWF